MQTNKPHSTKSEREAHLAACQQSGLSQVSYCKQAGINIHTFTSWIIKLKQESTAQNKFLQVEVADDVDSIETKTFATLTFSNQLTIELYREVSAGFLKQLIQCK